MIGHPGGRRQDVGDSAASALCPCCLRVAPWGHFRQETVLLGTWLCPRCWAAWAWGIDPLEKEPRAVGPAPRWEVLGG